VTSSTKKGGARSPAKGAKSPARKSAAGKAPAKPSAGKPDWTRGLRQLYDSVVDEPLPDNFKNLLDKLDKK
jgi:hypothetical protein